MALCRAWSTRPLLPTIRRTTHHIGARSIRPTPPPATAQTDDPASILSKPSWSVKSLLPENTSSPKSRTISSKQLHHLLRLSALPPPSSAEEEEEMLKTLESQIHFVKKVQGIDTTGVTPLRSISDESEEAQEENKISLKTLEASLKQERYIGRSRRIQRTRSERSTNPDDEVWDGDALKPASKTMGRGYNLVPFHTHPILTPFSLMDSMMNPRSSRGGDHEMGRQDRQTQNEAHLASVLCLNERQDLALLIVDIMDQMEQTICDHFNTEHSRPQPNDNEPSPDNLDPAALKQEKPGLVSRKSSTMEVKAEAEALRYFGTWKDSVIYRIGEIINAPDCPELHKQQQREGQIDESAENTAPSDSRRLTCTPKGSPSRYPPVETPLNELPRATKLIILHSALLLLLSLQHYSAHSRVLLLRMAASLGLSVDDLVNDEIQVAEGLLQTAKVLTADEEAKAKVEKTKNSRKWKIGLASIAGGVLIGVTGGLAAPFVAAGIGAVMGGLGLGATVAAGYLGAVASSATVIGGIFGAYGARMTGKMMERYAKEVEDFAFLPIHTPIHPEGESITSMTTDQRLRVTIAISGWLTEQEDFVNPWRVLGRDSESFALRWEFKALAKLGNALTTIVRHTAWAFASKQAISGTVFSPILGAVMWPVALLNLSHIIDNPFSIAKIRADKAGQVLADALINKAQGERPVTLVGYSMGARVIFSCLTSLAKRRAYGLVESAILIGSPTPSTTSHWRLMRTVVSGRLVNVFSFNDSILGFLYRANSAQFGIAGLQSISGVPGIENFDVSDVVSGHLKYQYMVGYILKRIGYDHLDKDQLQRQTDILRAMDEGDDKKLEWEKEQVRIKMKLEQHQQMDNSRMQEPLLVGEQPVEREVEGGQEQSQMSLGPQQLQENISMPEPSSAEVQRLEREVEEQTQQTLCRA
ncbi:DUF726 domain-containing protein [Histoplasma capsulatum G186AR]|uniref:DUF726 domain-containing protein n=1 Tax=Ajellomyces capsulatus (strain G186AR / H82 / ATCC MYA-2454 / RMSCC 2432) TaxID=447093 RepID=C0NCX7_AJECG|nr:DUF726 domain-containing protein [Histoplasma capsulatum G186AR]EEH11518.1 DUF726 domain-containing protein [Histoplasma capsulatum G186AR]